MPRNSRTSHTKTRNGCGQCKKRRCNLQAPICANCERRHETCDYQFRHLDDASVLGVLSTSTSGSQQSKHSSRSPPKQLEPSSEPPLVDSGITSLEVAIDSAHQVRLEPLLCLHTDESTLLLEQQLLGQTTVFPFLQHNIAAISSLRQTRSTDSRAGDEVATAYEQQLSASGLFRGSVHDVTDSNWFAVLAFAIAVIIFHLGSAARRGGTQKGCEFLETIFVLRGAALLGMQLGPFIMRSRLLAIVRHKQEIEQHGIRWDTLAEQAVDNLYAANDAWLDMNESHAACRHAIAQLQFLLRLTSCQPRTWLHLVWWPGAITPDYLTLLGERHPIASIVFVHWCAVIGSAPRRWFMDGWAIRTANSALGWLGPEWDGVTAWARSKLTALRR